MTVYVIAQIKIHDRDGYQKYEDQFFDVFARFDGKLLSVDEEPMVLEGDWNATRSVLVEFPSKTAAMAWMGSDDYQAIAKYRFAASEASAILVNGFEQTE